MLPPKRSTRTSLSLLAAARDEDGNSDNTSVRSETPVTRRPTKSPIKSPRANRTIEQKKARRKLTLAQKQALEELAARDVNPSLEERRAVALQIGL